MKFNHLGGASLLVLASLWMAGPSLAEDAVAAAETGENEAVTLPPLIVTGEKTERSIMDTASSVQVFSGQDLTLRPGTESVNDVLDNVPSFVTSETSNLAPAVRGLDGTGPAQGADAFFAGTRPRLNYMIDGRTLSYNESIFSNSALWDVDSVEVYTGPQSTLQGRNSIAGAVIVKTKDPTWNFEGAGHAALGSHDQRELSGAVSGPIVKDQLAVRLSADVRSRNDVVDFTGYPEYDNPSRYQNLWLRGKLLFQPASMPDLRALLTVNHTAISAPQANSVTRPYDDHVPSYPLMPVFGTQTDGGIADIDYQFSDVWSMKTVLTGTSLRVRRWATAGDGNAEINAREYAAEPLLKFAYSGISGFFGVHLFYNDQDETIDLFGGGAFDDTTKTTAVFGETTIRATDSVDLTLGGRLERETRDRTGGDGPFLIDFHETYNVFLPKATLAWRATDAMTIGGTVSRGYNGGGAGFTYDFPFVSYTYDPEFVWSYEIFTRNEFNNARVVLTTNIFYNDYKDLQLPFDLNPDPAIWSYVVRNADEAETYGAEIGIRGLIMPGLTAFTNVGLLHTEVTSFPGSGVEGNSLARSPAFTLNMGGAYVMDNGLDMSLDARYSDAYHSEVVHKARGKTDPYWIANAELGYSLENVRVYATVKNLFDTQEPVLLSPGATPAADVAYLTDPRTLTVGLDFTF